MPHTETLMMYICRWNVLYGSHQNNHAWLALQWATECTKRNQGCPPSTCQAVQGVEWDGNRVDQDWEGADSVAAAPSESQPPSQAWSICLDQHGLIPAIEQEQVQADPLKLLGLGLRRSSGAIRLILSVHIYHWLTSLPSSFCHGNQEIFTPFLYKTQQQMWPCV